MITGKLARTAISIVGLGLAASLAGPVPGVAAAEDEVKMCEGRKAGIIAVSGEATYGTVGDDVIYGERDVYIDGAGGDDVICLIDGSAFGEGGHDTIRVIGTSEPETLVLSAEDLRLNTGGGGDNVRILDSFGGTGEINLGKAGDDARNSVFFRTLRTIEINVPQHKAVLNGSEYSLRGELGVIWVAARTVTMRGGIKPDVLWAMQGSCRITMYGGKGPDELRVTGNGSGIDAPPGCKRPSGARLYGEEGRDTLVGGGRDDRLYGGTARDRAEGGPGFDLCEAEQRRGCEQKA